jgi:hypothetical protein
MKQINLILLVISTLLLSSCAEESLTPTSQSVQLSTNDSSTFQVSTCAEFHFDKPPVDILYIVDNSGSTLSSSFESIKSEISNTINNISNEFDYHIYFAPLNPGPTDSIQGYPLIVSDPDPEVFPSIASMNIVTPESLSMFSQASGNNEEYGFSRVYNIINYNRSNGIFRNKANTIVVMVSNGDDTESMKTLFGNKIFDPSKYTALQTKFKQFTKKYSDTNSVSNPLEAESFRFISLVAHNDCYNWTNAVNYKRMSKEMFEYQYPNSVYNNDDTKDLCSQNYASIFSTVNESIRQVVVGHKYDHWKISSASSSSIQEDDITVTKVQKSGLTVIPQDSTNGFEYVGAKTNFPTRYAPDSGEEKTGLLIKLNGTARVTFPDCLIAKTRTPTEYFGYISTPREPDLSTVKIEIKGVEQEQSETNGWSYIGYREVLNIKVPGPTSASTTPALNKTGYFFKLNGSAIFTNGDTINVYYKPKPL